MWCPKTTVCGKETIYSHIELGIPTIIKVVVKRLVLLLQGVNETLDYQRNNKSNRGAGLLVSWLPSTDRCDK